MLKLVLTFLVSILVSVSFKWFFTFTLNSFNLIFLLPLISAISSCLIYCVIRFIFGKQVGKEIIAIFSISLVISSLYILCKLYSPYLIDLHFLFIYLLASSNLEVNDGGFKSFINFADNGSKELGSSNQENFAT